MSVIPSKNGVRTRCATTVNRYAIVKLLRAGKKNALNPGTRVSLVIVLPQTPKLPIPIPIRDYLELIELPLPIPTPFPLPLIASSGSRKLLMR